MFDVGLGELLVITFLAIVILGPKRCVEVFREAGKWLKKLEAFWNDAKRTLE
jgi:sec-independent protein translocase protein TatB